MKKAVLFSAMGMLSAWGTVAGAEEIGRVISSTPVVRQMAVPRQVCSNQPLGNGNEASGNQVQNVQQCTTRTYHENWTVGYDVVYEYGGKEFSARMPRDPGPTIRLQLTPVGANEPVPADTARSNPNPPGTPVGVIIGEPMGQPMGSAPGPAYPYEYPAAYPAYPRPYYYPRPYFPIGLSIGLGYSYHRHKH